jgi:hypothetical protein
MRKSGLIRPAGFSAHCAPGRWRLPMHHRVFPFLAVVAMAPATADASEWLAPPPAPASEMQATVAPSLRLDRFSDPSEPAVPGTSVSRRTYLLPALASAILPGAGEIATGHIWNGIPLLAAEVAIWIGYAHYNNEGNQLRSDYEVFADQHWDYNRWQQNLEENFNPDPNQPGGADPPPFWWNPTDYPGGCDCSPPYIPKSEDPQEYYENAGKYRHFWPGWQDWVYNANDPLNSDSVGLRAEYISMRNRSNDAFDNAGTMIGLALVTRAISVAQTLWLVRRDSQSAFNVAPTYSRYKGAGMKLTWMY